MFYSHINKNILLIVSALKQLSVLQPSNLTKCITAQVVLHDIFIEYSDDNNIMYNIIQYNNKCEMYYVGTGKQLLRVFQTSYTLSMLDIRNKHRWTNRLMKIYKNWQMDGYRFTTEWMQMEQDVPSK